jgi:plasmid stabilization system protein ParE
MRQSSMRIVYLRSCVRDFKWIRHYYSSVFSEGERNASGQFKKIQSVLAANPFIGATVGFGDEVREFHVPRTPFSYLYRIKPDRIEILRILDNRAKRPDDL